MSKEQLNIEILMDFGPYTKGQKLKIDAKKGIPLDVYWRKRVRDSSIDGCIKVINKAAGKKSQKQESDK